MHVTSIYLIDDHPSVLSGLELMLSTDPGVTVSGLFTSGAALQEGLQAHVPDLVLMDIQMPLVDGIKLCRQITAAYRDVKVLAFTGREDKHFVKAMLQSGASGYLLKTASRDTVLAAIKAVLAGEQYIDAGLKEQLLQQMLTGKKVGSYAPILTKREREILKLIAGGNSNQQIADALFLSVRTVENHRFNLMQKLDVKNAAGLVRAAFDLGIQ
jgi:DNA-binding NarL/FixJ family response regulator